MNKDVNTYFTLGCGRCSLYASPNCKVLKWKDELLILRALLNATILKEESKWGSPCYTFEGKNVIMIQSFKSYCALMFFKGSLLKDEKQVLSKAGEHSNIARQARFTNLAGIQKFIPSLKLLIKEAIQVEKLGAKVEVEQKPIHIIPELLDAFKINPSLKKAFESLTPGRQRGYHIYFSQAKQSQTRKTRIEKYISSILKGKGMQD